MKRWRRGLAALLLGLALLLSGCGGFPAGNAGDSYTITWSLDDIPAYAGEPYVALNDNQPEFTPEEITANSFEFYSPLDDLGRCGSCVASVGLETMPTEDRESISGVHPTGWVQNQYGFVDGGSLYNRCHLIGFQLTGENANEQNLITGTRYLNVMGMLPFENMVADYVKETENHVMYRVTPIYDGDDLVARGVQMEGYSVEDEGEGVCFNVYCYNVQPGVEIDYATGENHLEGADDSTGGAVAPGNGETTYILNTSSKKFHLPDCSGAANMKEENRQAYTGGREDLIAQGYTPCGQCKP